MWRRLRVAVCCAGMMAGGALGAQTVKDGEKAFRDAVMKQEVYLRDFSGDKEVRWRWDGGALAPMTPMVRTLSAVMVTSVKVKGARIEVYGERHALLRKSDTEIVVVPEKEPVRVEVDLSGADEAALLPKLAGLLFYADRQSALAGLPMAYRDVVPAKTDINCCHTSRRRVKTCDCTQPEGSCDDNDDKVKLTRATAPKLKYQVDPEFSEEARRKKVSGNVKVGFEIDVTGHTKDLWIVRPMGFGLDEKAAEAVSQYVFMPATCGGKPVATQLFVDVNFQIF
jgi:TonB family protein